MQEWEKADDAVYAVARRAKELCDQAIDELRLALSSDLEGRLGSAKSELVGETKGDLVERLLVEEFCNQDDSRVLINDN